MISFVGAGPGAPDLLTLRAVHRLGQADLVVWASSLVSEEVLGHCRPDARRIESKSLTLEEVTEIYAEHPEARIVRLHSGDPTIYGAIAEQIDWCVAHERSFEVVPGIGSLAAAAAALGRELTVPTLSQSVVLTRLANRTKASMPEREGVATFAGHGATMGIFLSGALPDELQAELLGPGSGFGPETPAAIAARVSWPDEQLVMTTVGALADELRRVGATRTVLVLVGPVLDAAQVPARSHVYSPSYTHRFRNARTG